MKLGIFTVSALATAISLAVAPQALAAEKSAENEIEVIQVTGIRSQLTKAVATKRDNSQFVDAISADDMGKLPDANVAESLQRVSGVQLERGIGEGSAISIRGLTQNVILVNGRQVTTAGGRGDKGPDTLESSTYSLLSLIPSSLVSTLEVSKLSNASQIEGALGGVVNIVTRKPLDESGQKIVASVSGAHGDLSGDTGVEWSGLYSNTFNDDTLGFLISASSSSREFQEDGLNTFSGYGFDNSVTDDATNNVLVNRDMRFWQINDERDKTGINGIVQWRPTDDLDLYVDSFYSKVTSDRSRYWTGFWNCCGYENVTISENNILTAATVNRPVQTNTEYVDAESDFISTAIGGSWVGDLWTVTAEVSHTASDSIMAQDFVRYQTAEKTAVSYDLTAGDVPSLDFGGADLTSVDGLNLAIIFDFTTIQETSDTAARIDFSRDFDNGFLSTVDFGARYNTTETKQKATHRDVRPNLALSDLPNISTMHTNNDFFSGDAPALNNSYLVADPSWAGCATLNEFYDDAQKAECAEGFEAPRGYTISEDILALYAQANYESEIGDTPVSGNFGIRYVDRDLTSDGIVVSPEGAQSANRVEVNDTEILPSAVLKADISDDVVLRFGAARTLTFPNTANLTSGVQVRGDFTGAGGNPELNPFVINQFDFSAEWYFGESSILSAGLFYKDVDSFIINEITARNLPGFSQEVFVQEPINGEGGKIKGIELLYQQPFALIDGAGVMATYSFIDSETPFEDTSGNNLPMPGLSENNVNLVAYYEKNDMGIRLAYNWRDEYLQGLASTGTGVYFEDYADLSATANWKINDNFTVNFEAANLLDTRQKQFNAFKEAIQRNVEFGRSYKVTVSMNF
jgi:iron complex outermembrane receptor protein